MAAKSSNGLVVLLLIALVAVGGYAFFNMKDNRNGAERIGDAISELPNGPDKAAAQLGDRTPAERAGDAIENAVDDVVKPAN